MLDLPENKKIILFDGVCNLCDDFVQKVIEKDTQNQFVFTSLQSEIGRKIITHIGLNPDKIDSIVMYHPGYAYYTKSSAVIEIANNLGGILKFSAILRFIPSSLRDPFYNYVAKNRYKWYGKKESCMVPTPELRVKFLE